MSYNSTTEIKTKQFIQWIQVQSTNEKCVNKWFQSRMLYFMFCVQNDILSTSLSEEKFIYKMNRIATTNPNLYKKAF